MKSLQEFFASEGAEAQTPVASSPNFKSALALTAILAAAACSPGDQKPGSDKDPSKPDVVVQPVDEDMDDDGLKDDEEVNTHKTDPSNPDTDNDGLTDGEEVNTHKTNPINSDSDGDGMSDGVEVAEDGFPNCAPSLVLGQMLLDEEEGEDVFVPVTQENGFLLERGSQGWFHANVGLRVDCAVLPWETVDQFKGDLFIMDQEDTIIAGYLQSNPLYSLGSGNFPCIPDANGYTCPNGRLMFDRELIDYIPEPGDPYFFGQDAGFVLCADFERFGLIEEAVRFEHWDAE